MKEVSGNEVRMVVEMNERSDSTGQLDVDGKVENRKWERNGREWW